LVATAAEKRLNIRPYTSFAAASDRLDVAERMNAAAAPGRNVVDVDSARRPTATSRRARPRWRHSR